MRWAVWTLGGQSGPPADTSPVRKGTAWGRADPAPLNPGNNYTGVPLPRSEGKTDKKPPLFSSS